MSVTTQAVTHIHRGLTDVTKRCDSCDGRADWRFAFTKRASLKAKVIWLCDGCARTLGAQPEVAGVVVP